MFPDGLLMAPTTCVSSLTGVRMLVAIAQAVEDCPLKSEVPGSFVFVGDDSKLVACVVKQLY